MNRDGRDDRSPQDLSYVGAWFGDASKSTSRTELLVLLTPHVLRTEHDTRGVTEEMRRRMRSLAPVEMRAHRYDSGGCA